MNPDPTPATPLPFIDQPHDEYFTLSTIRNIAAGERGTTSAICFVAALTVLMLAFNPSLTEQSESTVFVFNASPLEPAFVPFGLMASPDAAERTAATLNAGVGTRTSKLCNGLIDDLECQVAMFRLLASVVYALHVNKTKQIAAPGDEEPFAQLILPAASEGIPLSMLLDTQTHIFGGATYPFHIMVDAAGAPADEHMERIIGQINQVFQLGMMPFEGYCSGLKQLATVAIDPSQASALIA